VDADAGDLLNLGASMGPMSEGAIDLLKVVLKVAVSGGVLTGAGWYIKYRFFDRPARDREFVVGVVKAGLQFLNAMEAQLTHSLWFDHECSDMARTSSDLQVRHAYVDARRSTSRCWWRRTPGYPRV
jgi:hypothetical protein